jgi:hypothetical protein
MFFEKHQYLPVIIETIHMNRISNMTVGLCTCLCKCIEVVDSCFYNDIHIDLNPNYTKWMWQSERYFIEIEILIEKLSPSDTKGIRRQMHTLIKYEYYIFILEELIMLHQVGFIHYNHYTIL